MTNPNSNPNPNSNSNSNSNSNANAKAKAKSPADAKVVEHKNQPKTQIDWDLPGIDFLNQSEFDPIFLADLRSARRSVVINCPFLKPNRLEHLGHELLDLPQRGVTVCVFVQKPRWWDERERANSFELARIRELEAAIALLQKHGVHVNLVKGIHQKICVIDGCVLHFGSLNILSYFDTKEEMMRKVDPAVALNVIKRNLLSKCEQCREAHSPVPAVRMILDIDTVGTILAEIREQAGYTQSDLSRITGISRSRLSRIERNECSPTVGQLTTIFNALGREICVLAPGVVSLLEEIDFIAGDAHKRAHSPALRSVTA